MKLGTKWQSQESLIQSTAPPREVDSERQVILNENLARKGMEDIGYLYFKTIRILKVSYATSHLLSSWF